MATNYKVHLKYRYKRCGPGGWYCPCCGPPPSHRKLFCRISKRDMYRNEDEFEELANGEEEEMKVEIDD